MCFSGLSGLGGDFLTENERIREIRKYLNLTLEKFGERVGVTRASMSNVENGNRNVTEQMRKAVCREFNINENWLRNGIEPMEKIPRGGKLATYVSEITDGDDDFIQDLIEVYMELDDTSKEALKKIRDGMIKKVKEREGN